MSCTIYYKGTLKENTTLNNVINVVSNHVVNIGAKWRQFDDTIVINFLRGNNETLNFEFIKKQINGFFKWNGDDLAEFYRIFDMFIDFRPLFKSLKIDDDEGLWIEYVIQKQPCKIKLRPLSSDEIKFLERIRANESSSPNKTESFVMCKTTLNPPYKALLRIVVQDFIEIMEIKSIDDFDFQIIFDIAINNPHTKGGLRPDDIEHFPSIFSFAFLQIWISNAFTYKKLGVIKKIPENIRGLESSMDAATLGIMSIFFNRHFGGASNSKEAEMRKLAKKYYRTGALGEVMVIDKPERELEFLFSMMDYLGFIYVGIE
jgi:hypothetical protein